MTDFIRIPSNPVPADGEAFQFAADDGALLRAAYFPAPPARATVVLMTGWAEFIEKYFEVVENLRARGLNVAMMDWRGQGLSDRDSVRRLKWNGYFERLRRDLEFYAETKVKPRFGGTTLLMTHSMGGMPALMLLAGGYEGFRRAVLCAPMTRLFRGPANTALRAAAAAACALGAAKTNTPGGKDSTEAFEGNIFTSDRARHDRFRALKAAEPRATVSTPTFGWLRDATKTSAAIHAPGFFQELKTPTRLISAGLEQQIDGGDHETIAARSDLIDRVEIPGALHEIMMERDELRELYWNAVDELIEPAFGAEA